MKIEYVIGDATLPIGRGSKIIAHLCNCDGAWGAGFVLAVSRRWREPEAKYRQLMQRSPAPEYRRTFLGHTQFVKVMDEIWVANMIGQVYRTGPRDKIQYPKLEMCLDALFAEAGRLDASVHMPRIGCGLAGSSWDKIEPMITSRMMGRRISAFVYDLPH